MNPIPEPSSRHSTGRKRRGINGENQRPILERLAWMAYVGCTSGELQSHFGRGHGQVSGALSTLHKGGHVAMLRQRRGRQFVYVLPEYVNGRECEPRRNVTAHDVVYLAVKALDRNDLSGAAQLLNGYVSMCEQRKVSNANR